MQKIINTHKILVREPEAKVSNEDLSICGKIFLNEQGVKISFIWPRIW
jgi:hypothetical protein